MQAAEVREMTEDQLKDKLLELKREQFNLRFQQANGTLEQVKRVKTVRRDIARVKTILTEKTAS